MAKKSDSDLERVVNSPGTYITEARLAAVLELKNRGTATEKVEQLGSELSSQLKSEQEIKSFEAKIFSKNSIYLWAFFVTPLLVGPFMATNIWTLGNRKGFWLVVLVSIIYLPLIILIANIIPEGLNALAITIFHVFFVILFVEWAWKKYLPTFEKYKKAQNG